MTQQINPVVYGTVSDAQLRTVFNAAMARVYIWMTWGLAVSTGVAWIVSSNDGIAATIFGNYWALIGLFFLQLALIGAIHAAIGKSSVNAALAMYFGFAALMGLTLSTVFLAFDFGTIRNAFWATSGTFAVMAFFGLTTKKDLTSYGPLLSAGLIGIIIASVVNSFLGSSAMEWIVSVLGVLLFMGLTAHDSQKIKDLTAAAVASGDTTAVRSIGVLGALTLYLDFVNLFLFILNLLDRDD